MSLSMLAVLVFVCVVTAAAAARVRHERVSLSLVAISLLVAAVSLALLAASVVGVARPDPVRALCFVVLASAGGGLFFGELGHVTRVHSGPVAVRLLAATCGVGLTTYALAA